jgi:hypothetical protein
MKHSLVYKPATTDIAPGTFREDATIVFKFKGDDRTAQRIRNAIAGALADGDK